MGEDKIVRPLTKVTLKVAATAMDDALQPPQEPIDFEFVYGIATEGLTAFEMELCDKAPGDTLSVAIAPSQAQPYFEHLYRPLNEACAPLPPCHLKVEVVDVSAVTDRELVHALSKKGEAGGCDCGGGCGCS